VLHDNKNIVGSSCIIYKKTLSFRKLTNMRVVYTLLRKNGFAEVHS